MTATVILSVLAVVALLGSILFLVLGLWPWLLKFGWGR